MIQMVKDIHNTPITNDGVYWMMGFLAVVVLIVAVAAFGDWLKKRKCRV